MRTMTKNKIKAFLLTLVVVATAPVDSLAGGVPVKFPTDTVQFGKSGSTANHNLVYDFGLGTNPTLGVDNATSSLLYNKNIFSLGDAVSSTKQFIANLGLGSANPKLQFNPSTTSWEFSNDGSNFTAIGTGSGGAAVELLQNPGFESGVAQGWSNTGGTFAAATSGANLLVGRGSATFTASAGGQFFQSSLYTVPNGLIGANCSASIMYKFGDGTQSFEVLDGSSNVIAGPTALAATTVATVVPLSFPCPATGSLRLRVFSASAGALYAYDQGHLGSLDLQQISQATLVGSMTITNCSTAWNFTVAGFNDTTATGCTYTGTGILASPSSSYPGFSAGLPAGEYLVDVNGDFNFNGANSGAYGLRMTNGTVTSRGATSQWITPTSGTSFGHQAFTISVPNATAVSDFRIQVSPFNTGLSISAQSANELVFSVYKFPSNSQQAITPDQSALSWNGELSGTTWSTTSGTFNNGTPSPAGPATFLEYSNRNFGTVTQNGTSAGLTWVPSKTGKYQVCAYTTIANSGAGNITRVQLVDGLSNVFAQGSSYRPGASDPIPFSLCGHMTATVAGSPVSFQMLLNTSAGTTGVIAGGDSRVEFTILGIDQALPAPLLVNSVVTPSLGVKNIVSVDICGDTACTTACTSDPCAIGDNAGEGVTAINWIATGSYDVHFAAGAFSKPPVCTVTGYDASNVAGIFPRPSTSVVHVDNFTPTTTAGANDKVGVICIGTK